LSVFSIFFHLLREKWSYNCKISTKKKKCSQLQLKKGWNAPINYKTKHE
jgi:hypothetical protein